MIMKIKANILKDFVTKCTANGLIEDCKLEFKEQGLNMIHTDLQGVIFIVGVLDKSAFDEYEQMTLEIKSTMPFIKALATFGDNIINIIKKDLMAKIMDENGGFDLALAEQITCARDNMPVLEYNNVLIIKKSLFDIIYKRNEIVQTDEIEINVGNKEINFMIGKESDKAQSKTITSFEGNGSAKFDWDYFKNLTLNMGMIVDMSLGFKGVPTKFIEKTDKMCVTYYLTPITENLGTSQEKLETEKTEENKEIENTEDTEENKE